jgi:DNA-directed RNA polymerase subunit omega
MARVTVEDCLQQVDNQYDLVILAKERTLQLGVGDAPQVPVDNDKRTVLALREIAEKKVSVKDLEESTIDRMRDHPDDAVEQEDFDSPRWRFF